MMAKNWDNTVGLVEIINAVALAVLYGVDDTTWNTVSKAACQYGQKDWLVGFLLSSRDGEPNYLTWKVRMKNPYQTLRNIIETSPQKAEDIKAYLEKQWYKGHCEVAWYDTHKSCLLYTSSLSSRTAIRLSLVFRANRAVDFVRTLSMRPLRQSFRSRWKSSRFSTEVPVIPSSAYTSTNSHSGLPVMSSV